MKKNNLTVNKGLSLSQAQSISNLCHQKAIEIDADLIGVNNVSKQIEIVTENENKTHILVVGKKLPENIIELLKEKAKLHGCQAFLMENIKAKDVMLKEAKLATPDVVDIEVPEKPKVFSPEVNMLSVVGETWGWEQLTASELNEYLEAEAYAAHIGQFIHNNGILSELRKELPTIKPIEWMVIKDGEKTPVTVKTHHDSKELLKVHEELARLHRGYEQRVNYFKAKVKNLVTIENARIANINADAQNECEIKNNTLQAEYETAIKQYNEKLKTIRTEFEKERQTRIKEIAAMRIEIDARFQDTIDVFLTEVKEEE